LSNWIRRHLSFAAYAADDRNSLKCLEDNVLADAAVNPPLNIEGCLKTPIRHSLTKLRKKLSSADRAVRQHAPPRAILPHPASPAPTERVKLHEEIADILRSSGNDEWMTTAEIAAIVNERGRYYKQNGTAVTNFQIHRRTRNYEHAVFGCRLVACLSRNTRSSSGGLILGFEIKFDLHIIGIEEKNLPASAIWHLVRAVGHALAGEVLLHCLEAAAAKRNMIDDA
jgi:hypothetical protein